MKVVLASGSVVRRRLLANAGLVFRVIAADVDESALPGESPVERALRLARKKALALQTDAFVIGADQVGLSEEGLELHKPWSVDDARTQLRALRGRSHSFVSAAAIAHKGEVLVEVEERATVRFHKLDDDEIERYLQIGEWRGSAGAYHLEGHGAQLVAELVGPESAVYGLPLIKLLSALRALRQDARAE